MPNYDPETLVQYAKKLELDNEGLRKDMAEVNKIANIPPADNQYGSLAERMTKIWMLSR